MLDFINKFFRREESSKSQAKERLRLVLMSDRVSLAPDVFDSMKGEMLSVVRRYLDIDERGLDVHFENAERQFMLLANIPVLKVKPVVPAAASGAGNGSSHAAPPLFFEPPPSRPRRRRRKRKHHPADQSQASETPPDQQSETSPERQSEPPREPS
jgi:cell division topological specificity factor